MTRSHQPASNDRQTPLLRLSLGLALCLAANSCGDAVPTEEHRLLVIDGIEITLDELAPFTEFYESYMPESGVRTRHMKALLDYVLPLACARRSFPEQRAEQLALAQGLCSVADNVAELEQHSELLTDKRRAKLTRSDALLPVAMYVFQPENTLAVSPPLELPHGWFVVASYDYHESRLDYVDFVDTLQVGFITHTSQQWSDWWHEERQRIGALVTFVHPDYRDDMPDWIQVPSERTP